VVAGSEVLVLGSNSPAVIQALADRLGPEQTVVDLVGLPAGSPLAGRVVGLCW
jgi:hypothetical protein